jgi:hypothetical protein
MKVNAAGKYYLLKSLEISYQKQEYGFFPISIMERVKQVFHRLATTRNGGRSNRQIDIDGELVNPWST